MKIAGLLTLIIFTTFLFCPAAKAQFSIFNTNDLGNVNIDNYSDEQLYNMYSRAMESGLSSSQFYSLAAERNMPANEITKLRNRLEVILNNTASYQEASSTDSLSAPNRDTAINRLRMQSFQNDQTIFGSELFTGNSLVFEPNLRIPAPSGYILGPDDEVIITVYGYSEKRYVLKVNEQGNIYIPNVGPIAVNGLSLEEAENTIRSRLASTIYRAIRSGQTKVQVSLGQIKSIRVTVIGQAKKPGTYTVSSLTTLYNLLYVCGGPTSMGSYRAIEVIRGKDKRMADLYGFLVNGLQADNILLQEGDVVRIPYYQNRVTLSGKVKREGKYEMKESETFSDLLNFSGGFTDDAYRGAVTVIRITDTARRILDVKSGRYASFTINSSDRFIVGKLQEEYGNRVVISGSVTRPGPYELDEGMTVKELITKAGGLLPEAFTLRASVFRSLPNKMPSMISVNLDSVMNYGEPVSLHRNDSLAVHSVFEFNDSSYVSVEGNVRKPGTMAWRKNMTLRDLLLSAGGLTESGDSATIEVTRRIKYTDVDKPDYGESRVFAINLNSMAGANDVLLSPYDLVVVKNIPGYSIQRSVLVFGEVKSSGKFGLQGSRDRISDVLPRTGGFKASADSNSITIRRQVKSALTLQEREQLFQRILNISPDSLSQQSRLKDELYKKYELISVDLDKALRNPGSSEDLALEDGDILTVDRSTNLVKISGEVYYPTIVPYQPGKSLKYYVEQAGSFTPYARKTGSLVINPDGKAETVKRFLFFKFYPQVSPRSEIFVPQKEKSNRAKLGAGELALIVSAMGILANVIINLSNK